MTSQQDVYKPDLQPPLGTYLLALLHAHSEPFFSVDTAKNCQLRKSGEPFHPGKVTAGNHSAVEFISHRLLNTVLHVNDFW